MSSTSSQLSLARLAHNIYGSLGSGDRPSTRGPDPMLKPSTGAKKLTYTFDREVTCILQLRHPLGRLSTAFYDPSAYVPSHHVIIGGRNYLKLLALDHDMLEVVADVNLIEQKTSALLRLHSSLKLVHVNTIKCNGDLVACGLTNGNVNIYQVAGNGKAKLAFRFDDHNRVVNSLDFVDHDQLLLSGSQDGTVKLWDLRSFQPKPVAKLMASQHSDSVRSCQYSPHSRVRGKMSVLSAHDSGALCKFDLRYPLSSHSSTSLPERKWTFHTGPALSLHIHPELEFVLTGGRDRKICAWNYGESSASLLPDAVMSTYGPVMKIRWNETASDEPYTRGFPDAYEDPARSSLPLFNYDFACLYLNDDPSITVYNLARHFVPREIVTTLSHKPFQNFIWAKGPPGTRKLWTITKSNMFVAYDLTSLNGHQSNIVRPYESLPLVATAWSSGYSNLSLVAQESADYDLLLAPDYEISLGDHHDLPDDERTRAGHALSASADNHSLPGKATVLSNPHSFAGVKSPSNVSLKDRPTLFRLATQFPHSGKQPSSMTHHRPISSEMHEPSRPPLARNPSQSTEESAALSITMLQSRKGDFRLDKLDQRDLLTISPYLVNVSVQIPLNDQTVFAVLGNDYLTGVPDAFSLAFVCQINARVAASVQRFRDCQVWRLISVALEQEMPHLETQLEPLKDHHEEVVAGGHSDPAPPANILSRSPDGSNSISSELGNLVGSYNSDSLTTNFGAVHRFDGPSSSMSRLAALSTSKESNKGDFLNKAPSSRGSQPPPSPKTAPGLTRKPSTQEDLVQGNTEAAIDIHREDPQGEVASSCNTDSSKKSFGNVRGPNEDFFLASFNAGSADHYSSVENNSKSSSRARFGSPGYNLSDNSQDLDNENLNFLNNAAASYSSSGYLGSCINKKRMSLLSRESANPSFQSLHNKTSFSKQKISGMIHGSDPSNLDRVEESSTHSLEKRNLSKLTKALSKVQVDEGIVQVEPQHPWRPPNIIKRCIEYAISQGDVVMSATLILLFYDLYKDDFAQTRFSKENCLECIGHYVESLRREGLFTTAVQVIKEAPQALKYELSDFFCKDVDMRFYCCWCQKLLSNEVSKAKYNGRGDKFGYWYCDECSRKQLNCVYCHEPCRGLAVVENLKCGHSGHFGCLQEWHFEENTNSCPGGCE